MPCIGQSGWSDADFPEEILKSKMKTLYWLSKQTGISHNALTKVAKNEVARLEIETIEKICNSLDCEVGDLLKLKKGVGLYSAKS